MGDTLIIHAGAGKTGSSALQVFFQESKEMLASKSISYVHGKPLSSLDEITSGNGLPLIHAATEKPETIAQTLQSYLDGRSVGLCSSEMLEWLTKEQWERISAAAKRTNIRLVIIVFVRNIIPLIQSLHDQSIKSGRTYKGIEEWAKNNRIQFFTLLKTMHSLRENIKLSVISYDLAKEDIIKTFLSEIGLTQQGGKEFLKVRRVNRSLTSAERKIMMHVNEYCEPNIAKDIARAMIYAHPSARGEPSEISNSLEATLRNYYEKEIDWVNENFFNGRSVLGLGTENLSAPNISLNVDVSKAETLDPALLEFVMDWSLKKLSGDQGQLKYLRKLIGNANSLDADVPSDFDPIRYLLLNPDLLQHKVDPWLHYAESGRKKNRKYRL